MSKYIVSVPVLMTNDDLTNLERLERAATPGPWEAGSSSCCPDMGWVDGPAGKGVVCPQHQGTKTTHTMDATDAELIAEMRNALPALLAVARAAAAWADEVAELGDADPSALLAAVRTLKGDK